MISIGKSLRTPKVGQANSEALWSTFHQNSCFAACPVRYPVDEVGRCASYESLNTRTAGCNSASEQIDLENAVERPYYKTGLGNADGLNLGYDTLLGNNHPGRGEEMAMGCKIACTPHPSDGATSYPCDSDIDMIVDAGRTVNNRRRGLGMY